MTDDRKKRELLKHLTGAHRDIANEDIVVWRDHPSVTNAVPSFASCMAHDIALEDVQYRRAAVVIKRAMEAKAYSVKLPASLIEELKRQLRTGEQKIRATLGP